VTALSGVKAMGNGVLPDGCVVGGKRDGVGG
jgi:hypothetical protein